MGKSTITGVVVAIPAFFQTAQIEATKRAVQMAGLELKMVVEEPTAAAIAYNEDKKLAKEALSFDALSYDIHLDIDLNVHLDLNVQLTKEKLNELCEELYTRTFKLIDDALRMANLRTDDIDHVILVGGSTRIPAIKFVLEANFGEKKSKFNINPDEAVVFGAAILADAIEKKKQIPLINYSANGLQQQFDAVDGLQQQFDAVDGLQQQFDAVDGLQQQFDAVDGFQQQFDNILTIAQEDRLSNSNGSQILFYLFYSEGKICLFDWQSNSIEQIGKFSTRLEPYEIATASDKIFGIDSSEKSSEILDLETKQASRGPDPPEWRDDASVAYFKDKLYYLGGEDRKTGNDMNRVDVRRSNENP
ncbi:hypothetical protein WR25_14381 isoform A [Diploscapter pachys]|uniref:Uncharacterized protein n=1 Tax=Diploscapter pachys TaxID=2018661 RepID=A0A2A2LHW6_9BILA|nr:hypothetical protein WR25_14381 isoform A [Diploscapter pachys]